MGLAQRADGFDKDRLKGKLIVLTTTERRQRDRTAYAGTVESILITEAGCLFLTIRPQYFKDKLFCTEDGQPSGAWFSSVGKDTFVNFCLKLDPKTFDPAERRWWGKGYQLGISSFLIVFYDTDEELAKAHGIPTLAQQRVEQ